MVVSRRIGKSLRSLISPESRLDNRPDYALVGVVRVPLLESSPWRQIAVRVLWAIGAKRSVLKGLVARSARRCAAFDPGGFGSASSRDITPMCHAVRASSPNVMAHAVARHSGVSEDR